MAMRLPATRVKSSSEILFMLEFVDDIQCWNRDYLVFSRSKSATLLTLKNEPDYTFCGLVKEDYFTSQAPRLTRHNVKELDVF